MMVLIAGFLIALVNIAVSKFCSSETTNWNVEFVNVALSAPNVYCFYYNILAQMNVSLCTGEIMNISHVVIEIPSCCKYYLETNFLKILESSNLSFNGLGMDQITNLNGWKFKASHETGSEVTYELCLRGVDGTTTDGLISIEGNGDFTYVHTQIPNICTCTLKNQIPQRLLKSLTNFALTTPAPIVPPQQITESPTPFPIISLQEITLSTTWIPTRAPTRLPTKTPTRAPTRGPTFRVTMTPARVPTLRPSMGPTVRPSMRPTIRPSMAPTTAPTTAPTMAPTMAPTKRPSMEPTMRPSMRPTMAPTMRLTERPTERPTMRPTERSTMRPSMSPSMRPTMRPTLRPSMAPSMKHTSKPSMTPSMKPTKKPTMRPTQRPIPSPATRVTPSPTWWRRR